MHARPCAGVQAMKSKPQSVAEWQTYIESLHSRSIDLTLERVREIQRRLGLERLAWPVVTVAGTNGKGSTVAMLEAMFAAGGYRVGAYTSPHLIHYNERIRIAGRPIDDALLCDTFALVEDARGDIPLTYFEYGTLAALQVFAAQHLDVTLLEVGLGGRLDAVNVIDADVAVITSVGIDHQDWLGPDREQIGREKAGIFRPGHPAICAETDPPASVRAYAREIGARLVLAGRDFSYALSDGGWTWRWGDKTRAGLPYPWLRGAAQLANAAAALAVVECLDADLPLTQVQVRAGLENCRLAGRFQTLPGIPRQVLDVAHNPDAARELRENLRAQQVTGKTLAVCAMLADKPIAEVMGILAPIMDGWHFASLDVPRGATAGELKIHAQTAGIEAPMRTHGTVVAAYRAACAAAAPADRIVVFGSFYTVGAIMRAQSITFESN